MGNSHTSRHLCPFDERLIPLPAISPHLLDLPHAAVKPPPPPIWALLTDIFGLGWSRRAIVDACSVERVNEGLAPGYKLALGHDEGDLASWCWTHAADDWVNRSVRNCGSALQRSPRMDGKKGNKRKRGRRIRYLALDCEMIGIRKEGANRASVEGRGSKNRNPNYTSWLARVSVVDHALEQVYDSLVQLPPAVVATAAALMETTTSKNAAVVCHGETTARRPKRMKSLGMENEQEEGGGGVKKIERDMDAEMAALSKGMQGLQMVDYRTDITGLTAEMLNAEAGARPYDVVQAEIMTLFALRPPSKTINTTTLTADLDEYLGSLDNECNDQTESNGETTAKVDNVADVRVAASTDDRVDVILVGHDLRHDLSVLECLRLIPQNRRRDTAFHLPFRSRPEVVASGRQGMTPSLRGLAHDLLGLDIHQGCHSSVEDARVAMAIFCRDKREFELRYAHAFGVGGRESGKKVEQAASGKTRTNMKKTKKSRKGRNKK